MAHFHREKTMIIHCNGRGSSKFPNYHLVMTNSLPWKITMLLRSRSRSLLRHETWSTHLQPESSTWPPDASIHSNLCNCHLKGSKIIKNCRHSTGNISLGIAWGNCRRCGGGRCLYSYVLKHVCISLLSTRRTYQTWDIPWGYGTHFGFCIMLIYINCKYTLYMIYVHSAQNMTYKVLQRNIQEQQD